MNKYLVKPHKTKKLPKGIPYIIANEAAERFSFYGMKAILIIYMTQYLYLNQGETNISEEDDNISEIIIWYWMDSHEDGGIGESIKW